MTQLLREREAESIVRQLVAELDAGTAKIESVQFEYSTLTPDLMKFTIVAADVSNTKGERPC